jgi:minor curlin subunit
MTIATSKLLPIAVAAVLATLAGSALAQSNINTTIQEGRVNTNDTYQQGTRNDNATYQEGRDNANRSIQRGKYNWNQTGQFGQINYNLTDQREMSDRGKQRRNRTRD